MRILLVDDEPLSRIAVADFLVEQLGHEVVQCDNGQKALDAFKNDCFSLVISDIRMPEMGGLELLHQLKQSPQGKAIDVILMTGYGDMKTAIEALRAGAYDFLLKPIDVEKLAAIIVKSEERLVAQGKKNAYAEKTGKAAETFIDEVDKYPEIIGLGKIGIFGEAMRAVAATAMRFHEERAIPVLIEGETGTGKEVIARMVHYGKNQVNTPFVSINCSAISPHLFESELFGYESGAFTGAKKSGMIGKFELAKGGTLFLDEIGELPLEMQPKLLRVLQEREIYRIGGLKKIPLDVRIICATNRSLTRLAEQGKFRRDLLFRLNVGKIFIPPLSQRKEDIALLAQMFLTHFASLRKRRFRFIRTDAVKILEKHSWPGNVRELQNTIERAVLLYDDIELTAEHLAFLTSAEKNTAMSHGNVLRPGSIVLPLGGLNLEAVETEIVRKALLMHNGNKTKTANYLGITRSALRSKLKKAFSSSFLDV